jgi:hypothetical protein
MTQPHPDSDRIARIGAALDAAQLRDRADRDRELARMAALDQRLADALAAREA